MMFITKTFTRTSLIILTLFISQFCCNKENNILGEFDIEEINPKKFLEEIEREQKPKKQESRQHNLNSIEDLPNFLQNNNLNEDEGAEILSKFLIQDDISIKKIGVIYDHTGFDALNSDEVPSPIGTEERLIQRTKSAANIYVSIKLFILLISLGKNIQI